MTIIKSIIIALLLSCQCISLAAQEYNMIIAKSNGERDSVIFGFRENSVIGMDSTLESNLYGTPFDDFDIRIVQRDSNSLFDCPNNEELKYRYIYDKNFDSKINYRPFDIDNHKSRSFEFLVNADYYDTLIISTTNGELGESSVLYSSREDTCTDNGPDGFLFAGSFQQINLNYATAFLFDSISNFTVTFNSVLSSNHEIIENKNKIDISPNPASTHITLKNNRSLHSHFKIFIFDIHGKLVINKKIILSQKRINISLENLNQGLYFCHILDEEGVIQTNRFIKI